MLSIKQTRRQEKNEQKTRNQKNNQEKLRANQNQIRFDRWRLILVTKSQRDNID